MALSERFALANGTVVLFLSCSQLDETEVSRLLHGSDRAVLDS